MPKEEAEAVAEAVFAELTQAIGGIGYSQVSGGVAASARMPTYTDSYDEPCMLGGHITGTFTVVDNTDDNFTGPLSMTMVVTPHGCVLSVGSRNITVEGAPSLNITANMTFDEGEVVGNFTMHVSGGLKWTGAKRCALDYTITANFEGHGTASGTACGHPISESF